MKKSLSWCLTAVCALFTLNAHATLLTDTVWVSEYLMEGQTASISHDLHPEIPELYEAVSGWLVLAFSNESADSSGVISNSYDTATLYIPGHSEDVDIGGSTLLFDYESLGLSQSAVVDLNNNNGLLAVSVTAVQGSFWWEYSNLWVQAVAVPEPATVTLFGAGVLLLILIPAMRRRRASLAP